MHAAFYCERCKHGICGLVSDRREAWGIWCTSPVTDSIRELHSKKKPIAFYGAEGLARVAQENIHLVQERCKGRVVDRAVRLVEGGSGASPDPAHRAS